MLSSEPVGGGDVPGAAALVVEDLAVAVQAVLVGGDDFAAPRLGLVVVVRQEVQPLRLVDLVQVEVLPDDVGLGEVDDLLELVVPQLVLGRGAQLSVQLLQARVGLRGHVVVEAVEVERVVHGHQELQPLGADGVGEQLEQVEPGALDGRVPLVDRAVPHGEPVVVLGDRAGEPGAGVDEELRPLVRVEVPARGLQLRGELVEVAVQVVRAVDEVVVRPRRRVAVRGDVVLVARIAADVHAAPIPLVPIGRNAEDAPVVVDAELGVLEPLGRRVVLVDRGPRGGVRGCGTGGAGCEDVACDRCRRDTRGARQKLASVDHGGTSVRAVV